jgi:hypothetical protein
LFSIKPAAVPVSDANGIVNEMAGTEVAFVTVEVNVLPLAVTVIGFTLVTVPPLPVAETIIEPSPFVIETPLPAVMVDLLNVPDVVPINISPFVNADCPVPPLTTGITPDILSPDIEDVVSKVFTNAVVAILVLLSP